MTNVMTRRAECVCPIDSLQEAAEKMRNLDVGPLPVCGDNYRLVGMNTDRDITVRAVAEAYDLRTRAVKDVMTPDVIYCFEDQDIQEAPRLMKEHQIRRLVAFNQDKQRVGIVCLGSHWVLQPSAPKSTPVACPGSVASEPLSLVRGMEVKQAHR